MATRKLTGCSLFVALGILLPMLFHLFGLGKIFLPMHIPVFLAGLLLGSREGLLVGTLTPLLSSLLTGMPPMVPPIAQLMIFELGTYGYVSGKTREKGMNIYISMVLAMTAGRIVAGIVGWGLLPLFGLPRFPLFFPFTTSLVAGLPGVIMQILVLPPLTFALERATIYIQGREHEKVG